jgi:hypothetical protein
MHPFISIKQLNQTMRHDEQVQKDRNNTIVSDPTFGHLAGFQVDHIERILDQKKLSSDVHFVIQMYSDGMSTLDLWRMFHNSYWNQYGVTHAFSVALNALLCCECTKDRAFAEVVEGLREKAEHITAPIKTLSYYSETFNSRVLDQLNQCRMVNGDLVSQESLIILSDHGLSKLWFESSAANTDVEAFRYLLKHMKVPEGGQTMLRKCARKVNAPQAFINAVLGPQKSVSAFAQDIIETVRAADIARIDEIYDQPLVDQCFEELIHELMDISLPDVNQVKAAQHFMGLVITSGVDTYRTFLVQAFDAFSAIDLLKQPRLSSHQIIDGVLRLLSQSANSRDVFLLGIDTKDICTHPKAEQCFDRLHKLTGDKQYLKFSSNAHKSKALEDAIGL